MRTPVKEGTRRPPRSDKHFCGKLRGSDQTFSPLNSDMSHFGGYFVAIESVLCRCMKEELAPDRPLCRRHISWVSRSLRGRRFTTCFASRCEAETQWATHMNGAQASPVAGAEPREVMPLVSYRASAKTVLCEIHEVAGRRHLAKQVLMSSSSSAFARFLDAAH